MYSSLQVVCTSNHDPFKWIRLPHCAKWIQRVSQREYLLVHTDSIQSIVHDIHPTVFRSQNKKGHEGLREVRDDKKRLNKTFDFNGSLLKMGWDHKDSVQIRSDMTSRLKEYLKEHLQTEQMFVQPQPGLSAYLSKVIKVVLVSDPFVVCQEAIWLVGDVPRIFPMTHKELSLEKLEKTSTRQHITYLWFCYFITSFKCMYII